MTKIGKLWTGAVAYVSLLVGAGLSVAGNLADTYRTRGADVDNLDRVMAAGWPLLVLLAIEMFVSPRWSTARMFQVWRWLGCLAVGGMAMVVSWTHLHDLMASRGQLYLVSVLGPLAIDGMAIMATGLILSTRVRGHVRTVESAADADSDVRRVSSVRGVDMSSAFYMMTTDVDMSAYGRVSDLPDVDVTVSGYFDSADMSDRAAVDNAVRGVLGDFPPDTSTGRPVSELDAWTQGYEDALSTAGQQLANEVDSYVSAVSTPLPQRTRTPAGVSVPADAAELIRAWEPAALSAGDMTRLLAASFGVSTRTVTRWRSAILGPVSGPPAG